MKTLKSSVFLFILILSVNVFLYFYLTDGLKEIREASEALLIRVEAYQTEDTVSELEKIKESLNSKTGVFNFILNQAETEKLLSTLEIISGYADMDDTENIAANLKLFIFYLNNIAERERVSLSNIF